MKASNIRSLISAIWADPLGKRWLLLSQGALVGMVVFDLLIPQAIRSLVNDGILVKNINAVVRGAFYMAIFAVASMLFATANSWYAAKLGEEVGHRLRLRMYGRISELSWGNIDRLETSDLLVRLTTDVNQIRVMTTGSVTTLEFQGRNVLGFDYLDDVFVTPILTPTSTPAPRAHPTPPPRP